MIDGQLTSIYLQSPLCKTELSGEELADSGAYIRMSIHKHFCQKIVIENFMINNIY